MDETDFLQALEKDPADWERRRVYADWLEQRGDSRAALLRAEEGLRTAPLGSPERQEHGRRWRDLLTSLGRGWLARIHSDAVVPLWLPAPATEPARLGVAEFYDWMQRSHREWGIVAARAPLEMVARLLIEWRCRARPEDFLKDRLWQQNVTVRAGQIGEGVSSLVPLVQMRGHAWTVAVYDIFHLSMFSYNAIQEDARQLSQTLGTVALDFCSEDVSAHTGYHLFACGALLESAQWFGIDGQLTSQEQGRPAWKEFPRDYPDALFRSLGLYIPPCYSAMNSPATSVVALDGPSLEEVERADLLPLADSFVASIPGELNSWQASNEQQTDPDEVPF
jgi:uncharacterized protein (TIGR02996 family)